MFSYVVSMSSGTGLQQRKIVFLEDRKDKPNRIIGSLLKSMLGLVEELVSLGFDTSKKSGFDKLKEKLDPIKNVTASISSARRHSQGYKIANYATYLFAFQQFFHSSYRARQGNVLEAILKNFFDQFASKIETYNKGKEQKSAIEKYLGFKTTLDADVVAYNKSQQKMTLMQIRSTDITGGTTAKASLVQLLKNMMEEKSVFKDNTTLDYVVYIWEELESNQKKTLISKVWDSLKNVLPGDVNESTFSANIDNGVKCTDSISLYLVYGKDKLLKFLEEFTGSKNLNNTFKQILDKIEMWDDLWLSYALTSLELENFVICGKSNFTLLEEKIKQLGIKITCNDLPNYSAKSIEIAHQIQPNWKEDTLPVDSPADVINYLRDLVLMKMIHIAITNCNYENYSDDNKD